MEQCPWHDSCLFREFWRVRQCAPEGRAPVLRKPPQLLNSSGSAVRLLELGTSSLPIVLAVKQAGTSETESSAWSFPRFRLVSSDVTVQSRASELLAVLALFVLVVLLTLLETAPLQQRKGTNDLVEAM